MKDTSAQACLYKAFEILAFAIQALISGVRYLGFRYTGFYLQGRNTQAFIEMHRLLFADSKDTGTIHAGSKDIYALFAI